MAAHPETAAALFRPHHHRQFDDMSTSYPRVLVFHPALPPYRVDLFNALSRQFQFRVVFLRENLLSQKFDQRKLRDALLADHAYLRRGFTIRQRTIRFGLWREVRRFAPDVVVTQEFSPTTLGVIAMRRLTRSSFAHVVWTDDNPSSIAGDTRLRRLARQFALPRIDSLIVLSEAASRLYRERFHSRHYAGVSPILRDDAVFRSSLSKAISAAEQTIAEQGLHGRRLLLFVGRLVPEKQVHLLVSAFSSVHRSLPGAVLALIGDGPDRRKLENLARSLGVAQHLLFTGRKEGDELHAWYQLASVFCLTSVYEPFGAVVNEALLAGVPVVCSKNAGASTLIRPGWNGCIVTPTDTTQLESALLQWLKRAAPIDRDQVRGLRPSLMPIAFSETVAGFVDAVREAQKAHSA
jgi:glycosyltransferase involved in cell wall biosynthesis